ncbi:MAG: NAD(P)H-hydrate dehydratase [Chitinispirillaceae bacterium]|nr:NAD(P)H-hydrate dehydratase [Chitinispirillaceae bacterium]
MIPVVTTAQMRAIDEAAIGRDLNTGYSYMLKAGMGLFLTIKDMLPGTGCGEIAVVCGKGNNGGDGYVVARLLHEAGYRVMCYSLCDTALLAGEAKRAFDEYIMGKGNILVLDDAGDLTALSRYALIVDAMLGTGARNDPHGLCALAIGAINGSGVRVVAVDTPSGLDCDTGRPGTPCVKASVTVTMGFPKIGLYFYPGREYAGRVVVHELGYPDEIVQAKRLAISVPVAGKLREFLPPRKPAGSKFDHGLALLVCGSRGMAGAATLVSKAAMRTGCGMTHCAAPASLVHVLSQKLTETVLHPVPETSDGTPSRQAGKEIMELASSMQAVCVGPGISHHEETSALVRDLVAKLSEPLLLDADGINAFKGHVEELSRHTCDLVITPHRGEWQRLFGELSEQPIEVITRLKEVAARYRMTVLLKGNPTIVADHEQEACILPFGNSGLAKAGSGDVLSGIIVSLMAQGAPVRSSAILGAYLHSEAGSFVARTIGEYSVIPSDVVNAIYRGIQTLLQGTTGSGGSV